MDLSELSLYEDSLKLYFVLTEGSDEWDRLHPMKYALEKARENIAKTNIVEVTPDEVERISGNFTRQHIVIFDDFKGECFQKISRTQALVLGPRSVISCFLDNISVPAVRTPMFNLAMRNLVICFSSYEASEKQKYRKLINYMGGECTDHLTDLVTHLVTDSVKSKKYERANMMNMKIMKSTWVHDVWAVNASDNVLATNSRFDKHKVPAFCNLAITTTGLSKKDKKLVEQLVESNGGTYRGEFSGTIINIVIAKKDSDETPKLKAALNAQKECLCVEWIVDSAKKGFALPLEDYRIDLQAKKKTSTPEKRTSGNGMNVTNMTVDISNIRFTGAINETALSNLSGISDCEALNDKRLSVESTVDANIQSFKAALEKLSLGDAKKAGLFLDGCNVFICGFTNEEKEKIVKVLNAGGATRYDTITSNLSHILIGNPSKKDASMLQAVRHDAILVKLQWLVDSIAQKTAIVDCQKYIYRLNGGKQNDLDDDGAFAPSPASKRNILSMSGISKQGTPKRLDFDGNKSTSKTPDKQAENEKMDSLLIDQYLNADDIPAPVQPSTSSAHNMFKVPKAVEPAPQPDSESQLTAGSEESTMASQDVSSKYLDGMQVYIHGFSDDSTESMIEDCEKAGAEVHMNQNYQGVIDYLILPIDAMTMDDVTIEAKHVVNQNWLINAKKANQRTGVPYFYEPIIFNEELKPLAGMVVAFSVYASDERYFLFQLAQILGADAQENFVRNNRPLLICPEPKSPKYEAAIRWNLTVVNRDWLLDCYEREKRLPMKNYLVGDSIVPMDDVSDDEEIFCSQPVSEEVNARKRHQPNKSNEEMPVICNRRVEQLRGNTKPRTPPPASPSSSSMADEEENDYMKNLDTPTRETIMKMVQDIENLTPQSKRRRYEEDGIKTPECATTPYFTEQRRQYFEELRAQRQPSEATLKEKDKTPWTEYKRRFWKNVLGEDYESPSQCYAGNTQDVSQINESIRLVSHGRKLNYEASDDTEADRNIKKLADFIKNRNQEEIAYEQNLALPNTIPPESEMPHSEPNEVIGWHDPNEGLATGGQHKVAKKPPCFTISCTRDDLQAKLVEQIKSLKGKVCGNLAKYDNECTHLLCEKPGSSEKTLSCISAGKWILNIDYIEKSYAAGRFLDEELFEWGNPKAETLPTIKPNDMLMAKAGHRWRKKIQSSNSDNRAFKDFRAILLTNKNDGLRTMVEAGGGTVIDIREGQPLHKQTNVIIDATHAICQPKYTKLSKEDFQVLEDLHVPAVSMGFLKAFITEETIPDVSKHLFN